MVWDRLFKAVVDYLIQSQETGDRAQCPDCFQCFSYPWELELWSFYFQNIY